MNLPVCECHVELLWYAYSAHSLLDVNFKNNVVTAGQLISDLALDYGTALNLIKFTGAVPADFDITLNGVAGTFTSVTEGPDGTYEFDFSGSTTGDDVVISIDKDGYTGSHSFTAA